MIGPKTNKFAKVNPPPGVADLFTLIAFLNDRTAVTEHLKEIQDYTDKANAAVERVAKADELEYLLAEAERTSNIIEKKADEIAEDGRKTLAEAESKATKIISEAEAHAEKIKSDAKAQYDDIIKSQTEVSNALIQEAARAKKDADAFKMEFEQKLKEVNETKASLSQLKADLSVKGKELEEKAIELTNRESEVTRKESILRQL